MKYRKNEFVVVDNNTNAIIMKFSICRLYESRDEAVIDGQNFCRDFVLTPDTSIYFRTLKA